MSLSVSTQTRIVWGVRIFLALAFGAASAAKLSGAAQMVEVFQHIGIGQWFRYVTGSVEAVGVVLLLVPATGLFGALLLGTTMVCAVGTHLFVIGGSPAPAIVLAVLSGYVAYALRPAAGSTGFGRAARA